MSLVNSEHFDDYERAIAPIINTNIANIYEINPEDFSFAMRNNGTIWSIALESEAFHKKAIDLEHFMRIGTHLKAILKAVAEEVVLEKGGNKEMVERYLQGCNLVKMDVEKLEVKMELPAELVFDFEQKLQDEHRDTEAQRNFEQELVDVKEQIVDVDGEEEQEKKEELEYVKEEEVEYVGKKEKTTGEEWKSDLINQKLQEVLCGYSSYFKGGKNTAIASKEQEIAALKSHLAVHDFIEEMALKQVHFSFFNKDYQKEFTLQIKEPLVEQTIEGSEEEAANS